MTVCTKNLVLSKSKVMKCRVTDVVVWSPGRNGKRCIYKEDLHVWSKCCGCEKITTKSEDKALACWNFVGELGWW